MSGKGWELMAATALVRRFLLLMKRQYAYFWMISGKIA
jgi:hypothetical protein